MLPLLMLALTLTPHDSLEPGTHERSLTVGARKRTYFVHIPKSYDGSKPYPVVLVFHGGASCAEAMIPYTEMNLKADKSGFIVVYPNGTGRRPRLLTWNAGNCCAYAKDNKVDDVAFTKALLDQLAKEVRVAAKRVYATGISNGGMICYLLASELSDRIAAIAPVSGPMGTEMCSPKRPVSVIHFHGTDDQNAPFKGGLGAHSISKTNFYSVEHSIRAWIKANGCKEEPRVVEVPDRAKDGTQVTIKTYGDGKEGTEVVLVQIKGGGHTWPGQRIQPKVLGKATTNISANDLMWQFFQKHPMK